MSLKKLRHRKTHPEARAKFQSAGRSGAVLKSNDPRFPAVVPGDLPKHGHIPDKQPWPLNENDLDLPTPYTPRPQAGEGPGERALDDPFFLGCLSVRQRGIPGPLTLDALLSVDGTALELGPFPLDRHGMRWLHRLLAIAITLTAPQCGTQREWVAPESGRGITGWDLAEGLAEGETRP